MKYGCNIEKVANSIVGMKYQLSAMLFTKNSGCLAFQDLLYHIKITIGIPWFNQSDY